MLEEKVKTEELSLDEKLDLIIMQNDLIIKQNDRLIQLNWRETWSHQLVEICDEAERILKREIK